MLDVHSDLRSTQIFSPPLYVTHLNVFIAWLVKEALLSSHRNRMFHKYPMVSGKNNKTFDEIWDSTAATVQICSRLLLLTVSDASIIFNANTML